MLPFFPINTTDGKYIYNDYSLGEYLESKGIPFDDLKEHLTPVIPQGDDWEAIADSYRNNLASIYNLLEDLANELENGNKRKKTYAKELWGILNNEFEI
jgi:hypothetical protein